MLPASITVQNYRAFALQQTLELRPLTLLYGDNNAGKSALLRLLPLLSDSGNPTAAAPLDLNSSAVRGCSFRDLRWKGLGPTDDRRLAIGLHWTGSGDSSRSFTALYGFDWFDDWRRLVVRSLEIQGEHGQQLMRAEWQPRPEDRMRSQVSYELQCGGEHAMTHLTFAGLSPYHELPDDHLAAEHLELLATRTRALATSVQWLTATRSIPARINPLPPGPIWQMQSDGRDALAVLAYDRDVCSEVSRWYERHLRREVHVLEVGSGSFRTILRHLENPTLDVDLIDTGEGMIQVLPVLTALAQAQRGDEASAELVAIEEPESHLHPSLQRALAEHIAGMVNTSSSMRVVLETHSEHLLLAVQLEIARGNIAPGKVRVYWVEQLDDGQSVAHPVDFDDRGRPVRNWPPGVFSEDQELARELLTVRRERFG